VIRYLIVRAVERVCDVTRRTHLDRLPVFGACRLADLSYRLDERWSTGAWRDVP